MTDTTEAATDETSRDKGSVDERALARGVAIGLPLVTVTVAIAAGVILGMSMAILVLAAGTLLGVIALFWASLRVLSGDAPLPPELEALDATAHGVDALASRKKMLLRALKDLENERALGKLEDADFEEISSTYRDELKDVLRRIDASLEPYRDKAEAAARAHLERTGLVESGYRGRGPARDDEAEGDEAEGDEAEGDEPAAPEDARPEAGKVEDGRIACATCGASNEPDAKFCKGCGGPLAKAADEAPKAARDRAGEGEREEEETSDEV